MAATHPLARLSELSPDVEAWLERFALGLLSVAAAPLAAAANQAEFESVFPDARDSAAILRYRWLTDPWARDNPKEILKYFNPDFQASLHDRVRRELLADAGAQEFSLLRALELLADGRLPASAHAVP